MQDDARFRPAALHHDPFDARAAPRRIGWLATLDPPGHRSLRPCRFDVAREPGGLVDTAADGRGLDHPEELADGVHR